MDHAEQRAWLDRLTAAFRPGQGDQISPLQRQAFDLATREGTDFYIALSDEDLLAALRRSAARLGHSPAQREVFWVWRTYVRQRFGKWPLALDRAGLRRAAGPGGITLARMEADYRDREALLDQVRRAATDLGRVPHPGDLPQLRERLSRAYATWGQVLDAAGVRRAVSVQRLEDLDAETLALLDGLRTQAQTLGRAPLKSEVDQEVRAALTAACGSWRNTLYQIGLEPVVHITPFSGSRLDRDREGPPRRHGTALHDCHYRVLSLTPQDTARLEQVRALAQALGRAPRRGEVPEDLRRPLQRACGSWSNALFQLGLE